MGVAPSLATIYACSLLCNERGGLMSPALPYGRWVQVVLRRRLTALLMTVLFVVMSAAPALAVSDRPKPTQPTSPIGIENNKGNGGTNEKAPDVTTGRGNRDTHGSPQNGKG